VKERSSKRTKRQSGRVSRVKVEEGEERSEKETNLLLQEK